MTIWFVLIGLAAVTLVFLLRPLLRGDAKTAARTEHDLAVYRDQLAELERERNRGIVTDDQAAAARLEIERRILALADHVTARPVMPQRASRGLAIFLAMILPIAAATFYLMVGAPWLPDRPLAARSNDPDFKIEQMIAQLSERLRSQPDAEGFAVLARVLSGLNRNDQAVEAWRQAVELGDSSTDTLVAFGAAVMLANGGGVVPEARTAFLRALKNNPAEPRAGFFIGLSQAQIGNFTKALAIWRDIERSLPADSPLRATLERQISSVAKQAGIDPATITPDRSDIARQIGILEK